MPLNEWAIQRTLLVPAPAPSQPLPMSLNEWAIQRTLLALGLAFVTIFLGLAPATWGGQAQQLSFLGTDFVAYWVDLKVDDLGLFWKDAAGQPLGTFARLAAQETTPSRELKFAINAGIYSKDYVPLGLHVERFQVLHPLNLKEPDKSQFNFYLKPNGVFFVRDGKADLLESGDYARLDPQPWLACQSGPLLLQNGRIHPAFRADSTNFHWRSGVGLTSTGQVVFAISKSPLRFHDFARLFQERLRCDRALYLDGDICAIYLPELGYRGTEATARFAAMFAVRSRRPSLP